MKTFWDMFAGIGGFRLAAEALGMQCTLSCENDESARKTYTINFLPTEPYYYNFEHVDYFTPEVPDLITAGIPCQPFSVAGKRLAMEDSRYYLDDFITMITTVEPKAFILENVPGMWQYFTNEMERRLSRKGYTVHKEILRASDYNIPTMRKRLYIVGMRGDYRNVFPKPVPLTNTLSQLLSGTWEKDAAYTIRVGGRRSGIDSRHNWDTYIVDGKEHLLTIDEAKKIMGFPDTFKFPVRESIAWKQLGNSIVVPLVREIIKEIVCG